MDAASLLFPPTLDTGREKQWLRNLKESGEGYVGGVQREDREGRNGVIKLLTILKTNKQTSNKHWLKLESSKTLHFDFGRPNVQVVLKVLAFSKIKRNLLKGKKKEREGGKEGRGDGQIDGWVHKVHMVTCQSPGRYQGQPLMVQNRQAFANTLLFSRKAPL